MEFIGDWDGDCDGIGIGWNPPWYLLSYYMGWGLGIGGGGHVFFWTTSEHAQTKPNQTKLTPKKNNIERWEKSLEECLFWYCGLTC